MPKHLKNPRRLILQTESNGSAPTECCSIESVVTVDDRGQMVLPKEVRAKAGIKPGEKLAVVIVKHSSRNCCVTLIKADEFAGTVRVLLGPMGEAPARGSKSEMNPDEAVSR
jgi:AbrB family looped-hinge helix DNA binding protein